MNKKTKKYIIILLSLCSITIFVGCKNKDNGQLETNITTQSQENSHSVNENINKDEVVNKDETLNKDEILNKDEEVIGIKINDIDLSNVNENKKTHEKLEYITNVYHLFSEKPYIEDVKEFLIVDNYELYKSFMREIEEVKQDVSFEVEPIFFTEAAIIVLSNPYQTENDILKLFPTKIVLEDNTLNIDLLTEELTFDLPNAKSYYTLFIIDQGSIDLINNHNVTINYTTVEEYGNFISNIREVNKVIDETNENN